MKSRAFMILLYEEDSSHSEALEFIQENYKNYAIILHDKDYNEVGEIKKAHYHIVLRFDNPRTITGLAKELNIKENYIEPSKNYISALRYLIHADNEEKHQYDISEVIGTLKVQLKKSLEGDKTESDYVLEIMELINEFDYIYMTDFVRIIAKSGLWSYYRRNAYTFSQVISEHNHTYLKTRNLT